MVYTCSGQVDGESVCNENNNDAMVMMMGGGLRTRVMVCQCGVMARGMLLVREPWHDGHGWQGVQY